MWKPYLAFVLAALSFNSQAQKSKVEQSPNVDQKQTPELSKILGFEVEPKGTIPGGWYGAPPETIFADSAIVHSGQSSVRIERGASSPNEFSSLTKSVPVNFSGTTIELSGFIRTEDVSGFVGLWLREDGDSSALEFDNMQSRQLKGTTPWTQYKITLPINPEAKQLVFGFLQVGTGKSWADDLYLLVDGKPIETVPKVDKPKTIFDQDHQFDHGSGIALTALTDVQTENLATLAKVWGFLKYHHPKVTSGQLHWDYELFRIMPEILAAKDHVSANAALVQWVDRLGPVAPCSRCAKLKETDLNLRPDLDWTANKLLLGDDLSQHLRLIYDARPADGTQFYVAKAPNIGNPSFTHELSYNDLKFPDAGYQLLGLFRYWNIIEYWSPDRDVVGEDWNGVLGEFIPKIALAKDSDSYQLEIMAMIGIAHDGHSNLWGSLKVRPPVGTCQIEAGIRFIENQPVVSAIPNTESAGAGLRLGDVITALDDVPMAKLFEKWTPYYAASNEAARLRDIARYMTRGECGESKVTIQRGREPLNTHIKESPL